MWCCSEGQAGRQDRQSQSSLLTVEAMLRIKESKQQGGSALSDEADLGSVSGLQSPVTPGPPDTAPRDAGAGVRDRHRDTVVTRTQAKLTYLLHLLLEAECLDWAGCLAIVLQDTMALVRIVNTAKSGPEETSARLYHGFQKLADTCPQYNQLISSVREHQSRPRGPLCSGPRGPGTRAMC